MADSLYWFLWVKFINIVSVYVYAGPHRHFMLMHYSGFNIYPCCFYDCEHPPSPQIIVEICRNVFWGCLRAVTARNISLGFVSLNVGGSWCDIGSGLVWNMVWCHQATSHYLIQIWPCYMKSYDVTIRQWVKIHNIKACQQLLKWYAGAHSIYHNMTYHQLLRSLKGTKLVAEDF